MENDDFLNEFKDMIDWEYIYEFWALFFKCYFNKYFEWLNIIVTFIYIFNNQKFKT